MTDANLWLGSSASYGALANGFELRIPEWFNMADATVGRHARGIFSDRIALVCSSGEEGAQQTLTYRELDLEARRCAKFLKLHGVRRGDVVICYTPQGLTAALTHLAAYLIGAIVAPLSLLYGRDTLRHAMNDSQAMREKLRSRNTRWKHPSARRKQHDLATQPCFCSPRAPQVYLKASCMHIGWS
ncbi:MAG: AMP-binding protein [Burkholderiales bacterium]|nr:AMP-binding protein [Burkholderiales bacterium]